MSRCTRTAHLDALVQGELGPGEAPELRAHALACAVCRHELRWLETEAQLFRQRAGRDEVEQLLQPVATSAPVAPTRRALRVLASLAATLLLIAGSSRLRSSFSLPPEGAAPTDLATEALASEPLQSFGRHPGLAASELCSRLPEGLGFHCGPGVPASFLASR